MNLKYVKINEGGKVSMKDETKGSMYTKEEQKLGDEICNIVNADKELKVFFKEQLTKILQTYVAETIMAWEKQDRQRMGKATKEVGELLKALTTHVYIKVRIKKQAVK